MEYSGFYEPEGSPGCDHYFTAHDHISMEFESIFNLSRANSIEPRCPESNSIATPYMISSDNQSLAPLNLVSLTELDKCKEALQASILHTEGNSFATHDPRPEVRPFHMFEYVALDVKRNEIRLLTIYPNEQSEPIHCSMRCVSLEDKPPYEAQSLSPDDFSKPMTGNGLYRRLIYLDGFIFGINQKLHRILRSLIPIEKPRDLWIDAICINQLDNRERESQKALLGHIFWTAESILPLQGNNANFIEVPLSQEDELRGHYKTSSIDPVSHSSSQLVSRKGLQCSILWCSRPFSRAADLERHQKTIHYGAPVLLCHIPGCERTFSRTDKLRDHLRAHEGSRISENWNTFDQAQPKVNTRRSQDIIVQGARYSKVPDPIPHHLFPQDSRSLISEEISEPGHPDISSPIIEKGYSERDRVFRTSSVFSHNSSISTRSKSPDKKLEDRRHFQTQYTSRSQDHYTKTRFACPFYKRDPQKYNLDRNRSCVLSSYLSISRIKEHIYRRHKAPISCYRCWAGFESSGELAEHCNQMEPCEPRPRPVLEGITPEIERHLKSRKKSSLNQSEVQRWHDIYRLLFPGESVPSPYFVSEPMLELSESTFLTFETYARRALPELVRSSLDQANMIKQTFEENTTSTLVAIVQDCQSRLFEQFKVGMVAQNDAASNETKG